MRSKTVILKKSNANLIYHLSNNQLAAPTQRKLSGTLRKIASKNVCVLGKCAKIERSIPYVIEVHGVLINGIEISFWMRNSCCVPYKYLSGWLLDRHVYSDIWFNRAWFPPLIHDNRGSCERNTNLQWNTSTQYCQVVNQHSFLPRDFGFFDQEELFFYKCQ